MQKRSYNVPKDKCPLDVLAEMGERTRNARILLHRDVVRKLKSTADYSDQLEGHEEMAWREPISTILDVENAKVWHKVRWICGDDIAFNYDPKNPEEIICLKMAE